MAAPVSEADQSKEYEKQSSKLPEFQLDTRYAFLFGAVTVSVVFGFGVSLYSARRRDPLFFKKMLPERQTEETGSQVATKALVVGSLLSVSTISLMVLGIYKLLGVSNFREFNDKLREYFPKKPAVGRVDFKDLQELADYLISEDRKAEEAKRKFKPTEDQS